MMSRGNRNRDKQKKQRRESVFFDPSVGQDMLKMCFEDVLNLGHVLLAYITEQELFSLRGCNRQCDALLTDKTIQKTVQCAIQSIQMLHTKITKTWNARRNRLTRQQYEEL